MEVHLSTHRDPLSILNQEICGQKPNSYAILWKILTFMKFCGDYYMIFMKIKELS